MFRSPAAREYWPVSAAVSAHCRSWCDIPLRAHASRTARGKNVRAWPRPATRPNGPADPRNGGTSESCVLLHPSCCSLWVELRLFGDFCGFPAISRAVLVGSSDGSALLLNSERRSIKRQKYRFLFSVYQDGRYRLISR